MMKNLLVMAFLVAMFNFLLQGCEAQDVYMEQVKQPLADSDGDGVNDKEETQWCGSTSVILKSVYPGAPELCDGLDNNCNNTADDEFGDNEKDKIADCVDPDDDNDNFPDLQDNCPLIPNADQLNTDNDLEGNACDVDDDNDGVPDAQDNCPLVFNFNQTDTNGDGTGDACQTDDDGDGTPDGLDCAPFDPTIHPNVVNDNCDGVDNDCDGSVDENPAANSPAAKKYFLDLDKDGYGNTEQSLWLCTPDVVAKFTALVGGDCPEGNANVTLVPRRSATTAWTTTATTHPRIVVSSERSPRWMPRRATEANPPTATLAQT